ILCPAYPDDSRSPRPVKTGATRRPPAGRRWRRLWITLPSRRLARPMVARNRKCRNQQRYSREAAIMANAPSTHPCHNCGERVSSRTSVCPFCSASLYDDADDAPEIRRRPTKRSEDIGAVDFIVPTNVSGASILACYMGLIGFCLPLLGLVFASRR